MGISLNTLLGALSGGASAYGHAEDRAYARRRQESLDAMLAEDRQSQRERREYENMGNLARMADDGIRPASAITDVTDFGPLVSGMAGVAGGTGVGLPSARLPNPQHYTPVGSAGGHQFYYNPDSTKEATALHAKEVNRAAEVARMLGMKKPDGTAISQAEAEAIVDGNVHYGDFKEKNIDRLSTEGLSREEQLIAFRTRAQAAAKAAAAKTGKTETREQREKYYSAVAERLVKAAAAKRGGSGDEATIVNDALAEAHRAGNVSEGVTAEHLRAAYQEFVDRFTAKSKAGGDKSDPFDQIVNGPSLSPGAAAGAAVKKTAPKQVDAAAIKRKYGLE